MSETFPTNMPEATKRHILSFSKRFGQSHLYLAYHAAFPLALTPDLLYRLWANFQHDIHGKRLSIPWVAVADLLLSSLCEDVGHELYEMNVVLRNALLHNLKSNVNFGDQRIHELSDFLLAYVEQQLYTPNADTRDFAKSQRWTALAYTRPGAAAHELTSALLLSLEKDDKAEQIRIASLIETFAEPLAEFVPLLTYARGMKHYVYGDENKAKVELSKLVEQDLSLSVSEVNSPISEHLLDKTETSLKATFVPSPQVHQGSFRGSLSGFGTIEIIQVIEMSWKNGALLMKNSAERTGILYFHEGKLANCFEYNTETLILGDVLQQLGMATASQIEQAFSQQLRDAFGIRIGERLIMMGVINEKQLNEAVRTRALWIARELALWVEGSFEFISSLDGRSILPYDEESLEIEGMRVTMEMIKYADDWEQLRMYFPMGIHTTLAMNPAIPYTMRFGMQDLELMTAANRFHSIRHIANAVRRPEIDVAYDLVRLVQQRVLSVIIPPSPTYSSSYDLHLPAPAEKLRMDNFEFLDLINRMREHWSRQHSAMNQLSALVEYINWTMEALTRRCQANGIELKLETLEHLLSRQHLDHMGNYRFIVRQNRIDVDNFASLCYEVLTNDLGKSESFYDESVIVLPSILRFLFTKINSRVASLLERLENQAAWEILFTEFTRQRQ